MAICQMMAHITWSLLQEVWGQALILSCISNYQSCQCSAWQTLPSCLKYTQPNQQPQQSIPTKAPLPIERGFSRRQLQWKEQIQLHICLNQRSFSGTLRCLYMFIHLSFRVVKKLYRESSWIRLSFWMLLAHPFSVQHRVRQVTSKWLDQVLDGIQSLCSQSNARRCCCKDQYGRAMDLSMFLGTYSPHTLIVVQQQATHQGRN